MSRSRSGDHHAVFGSLLGLLFVGTAWAQGEATPPAAAPSRRADASTPTAASTPTNAATPAPGAAASAPATPATDAAAKPGPAAGSTAAGSASAPGSTAASTATATPTDGAGIRVEKAGSGKLFRITEGMLVEGQRQKPNAFYVLQRASAAYDWESLDENFLQRIIKSTEKPPF